MIDHLKRILSFIFGPILTIDGCWLIAQNKIHLGTLLPLIIGIGLIVYALLFTQLKHWYQKTAFKTRLWNGLWIGFFIWIFSVALFFIYIQYSIHSNTSLTSSKAIIVLGSGIENGKPSQTLKNRLDTAANYAKQHPNALIIMTGGLGYKEKFTEAEIMTQYITSHYPHLKNPIALEDRSTSTELNLANAQQILENQSISLNQPIAIVTSDFHSLRARAIATHQGYQQIISISANTPLYLRYNSWLREYFAYISGFILREY